MNKTIKIPGFIIMRPGRGVDDAYIFSPSENAMADYGYVPVGPHEIIFEMPAEFNPTAAEVLSLEAQKRKLSEEFNSKVRMINDRISKLQALEFNPSGVAA